MSNRFELFFFAEVFSFQEIHSEIEKILITDNLVENWTYPLIQPQLIEEANAFKKLNEEYNKSYRDIAVISGKSKTTIADIINLSNFSDECKNIIQEHKLKNTSILNSILKCDPSEHYELVLRLAENDLSHKDIKNKVSNDKNEDISEKPIKNSIQQYKLPKGKL